MPEWLGKTIGKVRIDKYIARGGMAEVYLGTHLTLERSVAVKVLHGFIEEDPELIARFHREAKVVAGLRHSNIVQIYDFDAMDGSPYIVMEYLSGPTLAHYLRAQHTRGERIPPHQVARLLKGITAALDYAHGLGMVHRDIKPGNIILQSNTSDITLDAPLTRDVEGILTDFGLVRITNSATQTATGSISGTAAYMSPEQARGDKTDHRSDIYSLGIVLYEMLAGRVPFEADTTLSVMYMQINEPPPPIKDISPRVQAVLDRALNKDPGDRYQSSREMAVDFFKAVGMTTEAETILDFASVDQKSDTVSRSIQPARSNRTWLAAGIGIGLVLVIAIGGLIMRASSSNDPGVTDTQAPQSTDVDTTIIPSDSAALPESENMVEIPTGSYTIGRDESDEFHISLQTIQLNQFWIDMFQVTNAQYQQFMDQTGAQAPLIYPASEKFPVRGVTWDQANAYCSWKNKRLPKEAEWEVAGRGSGSEPHLYPWGNDSGNALNLPEQDTYEVGTVSFNVSPFGVYDLVGNVWEWTGDAYAVIQDGYKILRGGRYGLPQDLAYRLAVAPDNELYTKYAGFRCAADKVK